jgi:hypothetical protein
MSQKSIMRRQRKDEATAGEILVGFAWAVLYTAVIAYGLASDALLLLAGRGLPNLF